MRVCHTQTHARTHAHASQFRPTVTLARVCQRACFYVVSKRQALCVCCSRVPMCVQCACVVCVCARFCTIVAGSLLCWADALDLLVLNRFFCFAESLSPAQMMWITTLYGLLVCDLIAAAAVSLDVDSKSQIPPARLKFGEYSLEGIYLYTCNNHSIIKGFTLHTTAGNRSFGRIAFPITTTRA